MTVSRKKYGDALRMLKAACRQSTLPWTQRLRAAEMLMMIYGVHTGEMNNKRDVKTIRELVEESTFDQKIKDEMRQKSTADAIQVARKFLADVDADTVAVADADAGSAVAGDSDGNSADSAEGE